MNQYYKKGTVLRRKRCSNTTGVSALCRRRVLESRRGEGGVFLPWEGWRGRKEKVGPNYVHLKPIRDLTHYLDQKFALCDAAHYR